MSTMNRIANTQNPYQGDYKKVLCVCSAGLLRSPTVALVLSQKPYSFNTRAVGLSKDYALIVLDNVLLSWADEIVCMTKDQQKELKLMTSKPIICLNIPDNFQYRNKKLIKLIKTQYNKETKNEKK
jgi:predicted protein tyrosine phosphatase